MYVYICRVLGGNVHLCSHLAEVTAICQIGGVSPLMGLLVMEVSLIHEYKVHKKATSLKIGQGIECITQLRSHYTFALPIIILELLSEFY